MALEQTNGTPARPSGTHLCAVCWNATTPGRRVTTPCNHVFCTPCFFNWMKEKRNCPVCRRAFASETQGRAPAPDFVQNIIDVARIQRIERQLDRLAVRNQGLSRTNVALEEHRDSLRRTLSSLREEVRNATSELERLTRKRRHAREGLRALSNYHREWRALYEQRRRRRRLFFPS